VHIAPRRDNTQAQKKTERARKVVDAAERWFAV
jgi:hypothetical protein